MVADEKLAKGFNITNGLDVQFLGDAIELKQAFRGAQLLDQGMMIPQEGDSSLGRTGGWLRHHVRSLGFLFLTLTRMGRISRHWLYRQ